MERPNRAVHLSVLLIGLLAALWLASRVASPHVDGLDAPQAPTSDAPDARAQAPATSLDPGTSDAGDAGDGEAELVWVSLAPYGSTGSGMVISKVPWKKLLPWEQLPEGPTTEALDAYYAAGRGRDPAAVLRASEEEGLMLDALAEDASPWEVLLALQVERIRAEVDQDRAEAEAGAAFEEEHGIPPQDARGEARSAWRAMRPEPDAGPRVEAALTARERWPDSEAWATLTLHAAEDLWDSALYQGGEEQGWELCLELMEADEPVFAREARELVLRDFTWEFDEAVADRLRASLDVNDRGAYIVGFFVMHAALRAGEDEQAASWFTLIEEDAACTGEDIRTREEVIANPVFDSARQHRCGEQARAKPMLVARGVLTADTWQEHLRQVAYECNGQHPGTPKLLGEGAWEGEAWAWSSWAPEGELSRCVAHRADDGPRPPMGTQVILLGESWM